MSSGTRCAVGCAMGLAFVLMGWAVPPTLAQPRAVVPDERPELRALRSRIDDRFNVMTIRTGLVLVPRRATRSYSNIELADDGVILVDGTAVTGRELRARVPDADLVAQLSYLDADTRRAMFAPAVRSDQEGPRTPLEPPSPAATPAAPEAAAPPEPRVLPGGWIERERYRRGGARVRIGGDVWVRADENVGDAVVAIFGSAHVDGRVDGDVVAVGGRVVLGPRADVRGNAVSIGGGVDRDPGARIQGDLTEVRIGSPSFGPFIRVLPWHDWRWFGRPFGGAAALFGSLMRMAVLGLLVTMIVAFGGRAVRRVGGMAAADPWRSALAGLAAQIFFFPLLVVTIIVLAVSIIGIPLLLLVPFGLLAVLFGLILGFAGVGWALGQAVGRRAGGTGPGLFVSLVLGLTLIWALTVIARFVGLAGGPVHLAAGAILVAGFVIEYAAWTVGLGAVLLSRFGRRGAAPERNAGTTPPAVPPAFDAGTRAD